MGTPRTELTRDDDFRASVRRMAEHQAAERAEGDTPGLHRELTAAVRDTVQRALDAAIDPASAAAGPVVDELATRHPEELLQGRRCRTGDLEGNS